LGLAGLTPKGTYARAADFSTEDEKKAKQKQQTKQKLRLDNKRAKLNPAAG
jgi:hypothetical protein